MEPRSTEESRNVVNGRFKMIYIGTSDTLLISQLFILALTPLSSYSRDRQELVE